MTQSQREITLENAKHPNRDAFVEKPSITLISRPSVALTIDEINSIFCSQLQAGQRENASERIVEIAGRVCYMSFNNPSGRSTAAYIKNLIRQGHESVLEHATWTVILSGVSRAFTHQLVRHRVGFAFSQLSQQYVDQSALRFVVPAEILVNRDLRQHWEDSMLALRREYGILLQELKAEIANLAPKERIRSLRSAARSILPNCIETMIAVTGNARAFRHFLSVRGSIEGDIEMRRVSSDLLALLNEEAPNLFADFQREIHIDDWPILRRTHPLGL
jgi:thymidylate synthase (FAD)